MEYCEKKNLKLFFDDNKKLKMKIKIKILIGISRG
jgi:hypothetical protein